MPQTACRTCSDSSGADRALGHALQGPRKQFVGVVQPSENSFALAIVVDATGHAPPAPRIPM